MRPDTAKMAMEFLMRTQITGQEVPAFTQVMQELQGIAHTPSEVPTQENDDGHRSEHQNHTGS